MFPKCRDYPDHIIVKDHPWEVKFCRKTPEGPDSDVGLYDPEHKTIYIRYKQAPRQTFMTAFHEWLHIVEDEYEINIGHAIIEKLEEAMADFLEQNPEIFVNLLYRITKAE